MIATFEETIIEKFDSFLFQSICMPITGEDFHTKEITPITIIIRKY